MESYSVESITHLIAAQRYGTTNDSIRFVLTDSRSLCFPAETLFFALKSERNDGMNYVSELYQRGVRNFVVERLPDDFEKQFPHTNFLLVANVLTALQTLATHHRHCFNIPIIGITGSNGKTMVKEWLYQLLSEDFRIVRSPRSYNSQIGVPLSVWLLKADTELGIFEAGISKPREMQLLEPIIEPTIGIITNIGTAHQENFATLAEKCEEKIKLFRHAKIIIFPADDAVVCASLKSAEWAGELVSWSFENEKANFYVQSVEKTSTSSTLHYVWQSNRKGAFTIPFIDDASISNAVSCFVLGLVLHTDSRQLAQRMHQLEPIAMRLEVKEGQHGCTLINDAYNSDFNSLNIALDFMNRRPDHKGRKRTLILSDMLQSGEDEAQLYQEIAHLVSERNIDKFIGIGDALQCHQTCFSATKETYFFHTIRDFLASNVFRQLRNEMILIKGARVFEFETLAELLAEKVHETVLEVNLNALVENLNWYRTRMQSETKLVCMIKADGYGVGAVEIAKTLQDHRVDYLAVAVADEGVALRRNGITSNIMVMNPEMSSLKTLFDYDLEPEVYSFRLLDALIKAAEKEGITHYPVHIKLDTGMHRLGFHPSADIDRLISRLKSQNAITPKSVFSHFVGADADVFDAFSAQQFNAFDGASQKLQAAFSHKILRHIDNSAGIEHFPERQLDMCRLGLGLYGVNPRTNEMLHNVSTLKTTILQMRHVAAGETVGYSRKGVITKDSKIAAIPIGYADGLNRKLGNRHCYCLVNGQRADYVGNICMDVSMIDVTNIDCEEGDVVEIFGDHLPVTVLSDVLETIPYEVLTNISGRVKRVYFQD